MWQLSPEVWPSSSKIFDCPLFLALAQVLVVAGGISVGSKVRALVKDAQKQQKQLCAELAQGRANQRRQQKIAVDKKFFRRLMTILSM